VQYAAFTHHSSALGWQGLFAHVLVSPLCLRFIQNIWMDLDKTLYSNIL